MPLVTGSLTDFGLDPLTTVNPVLIFRGSGTGLTGINLLSARKAIEVYPSALGSFIADLVSTDAIAPANTHYIVEIRYRDAETGQRVHEVLPWKLLVPPAGGPLADLLRVPANPALVWVGPTAPENVTPGSWWLDDDGDLSEYNGAGWTFKANLRGPAGYNATDAAGDAAALAAFVNKTAGPNAFATALEGKIGEATAALESFYTNHMPPLTNIQKARTAPFRILLTGTSISSFNQSTPRVLVEHLANLYGRTGAQSLNLGIYGGSYTNTMSGWKKQVYGGPLFTRLVSTGTSTPITFNITGDELALWTSKETDSGQVEVIVDGVSKGLFGATAGGQAYAQLSTVALGPGSHMVTINPPASGRAYLERISGRNAARAGIEWIDGTLGGSGIWNMTTNRPTQAGQEPAVPIVGQSGLAAHFARDDIDLWIVEHIFNDTGVESDNGVFEANTNYAVEQARLRGKPIMFIIEPGGGQSTIAGYASRRAHLLSLRKHPHVTVIDWHAAIWPGSQAELLRLYYPGNDTSHPLQQAYDVLNAIITRALGIPPVTRKTTLEFEDDLNRDMSTFYKGASRQATVNGAAKVYAVPEAPALRVLHAARIGEEKLPAVRDWAYRDTAAVNKAAAFQADIDASATSDAFGKYLDCNNKIHYVNYLTAVDTDIYTITVKVSGTFIYIINNPLYLIDDQGRTVPKNEPTNNRYFLRHVVSGPEPVVFTFTVAGATLAASNQQFSGRIYDLSVVKSTVPVLI